MKQTRVWTESNATIFNSKKKMETATNAVNKNSDDGTVENHISPPAPTEMDEYAEKPKMYTVQKYRKQWEKYEKYKHWLCEVPGDRFKARCRFCNLTMSANFSVLNKHVNARKHLKSVPFRFQPHVKEEPDNDDTLKAAEVLMCAFLVSHDLPFKAMDELGPILKECFSDSYTARDMKLRRTKASRIVSKVIFPTRKEAIVENLRISKFSVVADLSPGADIVKQVCVVVCYNDPAQGHIVSQLWEVLDVARSDVKEESTAVSIYSIIIESFVKWDIPVATNLIGFAAERSSLMLAAINSVSSQFEEQLPGVVILERISQSAQKVAVAVCKLLPDDCEDLAKNVHAYLKQSSKRQDAIECLRPFREVEKHPQGSWLCHIDVVERMLSHWDALQSYFTEQWRSDRSAGSETIYNALHDGFVLSYYKFLKWVLPKFTLLENCSELTIADVTDTMNAALLDLLSSYMPRDYLLRTALKDIDATNEHLFLPLSQLRLGEQVVHQMQNEYFTSYPEHLEHFLRCCRTFLATACHQLKLTLDFESVLLSKLSALSPKNVVDGKFASLVPLMGELPRIVGDEETVCAVDAEWRSFLFSEIPEHIAKLKRTDSFWNAVHTWRDDCGNVLFPNLSKFALEALSLPYANADCEKIFIRFYAMHGKSRTKNGICVETLKLLMASECIRSNGCCVSIKPTQKMFQLINKDLYKTQSAEIAPPDDVNYIISYFMDE